MVPESTPLSSPILLENLFNIPKEGYTTGSERLDGFIIGLATMLLIRSAEFVIIDLLTLCLSNRSDKIAYRVLRTWQMLNMVSIFSLLTGFDSDIPCSRFKFFSAFSCPTKKWRVSRFHVSKGKFATVIFISVLFGKLFVLSSEVAIIAFAIPSSKVHMTKGGVSLVLRESVISEVDMENLRECHSMFTTTFLTEAAQLSLCRRVFSTDSFDVVPPKWLPNENIRIERTMIKPDFAADAGAILRGDLLSCRERAEANAITRRFAQDFPKVNHQAAISDTPNVTLINDINVGELAVYGFGNMLSASGRFHGVAVGMTPIFTDRHGMLRLSFADWINEEMQSTGPVWTLNGKLLFGDKLVFWGRKTFDICPGAVDEIIRVTGTLDAGMTLDLFLLSTEVKLAPNFSAPITASSGSNRLRGFEIGVSRKYTITPIWISVLASLAVLLSAVTMPLNHTEAAMARTFREQNGMNCACSPVFLQEETHAKASLFRSNEKYRWGMKPGENWEQLDGIYFSQEAVLT